MAVQSTEVSKQPAIHLALPLKGRAHFTTNQEKNVRPSESEGIFSLTEHQVLPKSNRAKQCEVYENWKYSGIARGLGEPSLGFVGAKADQGHDEAVHKKEEAMSQKNEASQRLGFVKVLGGKESDVGKVLTPRPVELLSSLERKATSKSFSAWTKYTDSSILALKTRDIVKQICEPFEDRRKSGAQARMKWYGKRFLRRRSNRVQQMETLLPMPVKSSHSSRSSLVSQGPRSLEPLYQGSSDGLDSSSRSVRSPRSEKAEGPMLVYTPSKKIRASTQRGDPSGFNAVGL